MNELIKVVTKENGIPTVNARDLHNFLGCKRDFSNWIKGRIDKYSFAEGSDYLLAKIGEQLPSGIKYKTEYFVSLDMAKELSMVENNDKGKEARSYFISVDKKLKNINSSSSLTNRDLDIISALVSKTIAATTELLSGRMQNIESAIEKRKALLPAPEIKHRDAINKLVREYVTRTKMPYTSVWNKVYSEFNYTYNVNARICASNRNMPIIDYIETEGMIDQLLSVTVKALEE